MRIGFDIDGVLAAFVPRYQSLVIETDGRNLFHPGDDRDPPCWNWPELRGYSTEVMQQVWAHIAASPSFWYSLAPTHELRTFSLLLRDLEHRHDLYYIASRPGTTAKRQTEAWLQRQLSYDKLQVAPTVLISSRKAEMARGLQLDCYIDDNLDNAHSIGIGNPGTRSYLLDRAYNQEASHPDTIHFYTRVGSLAEFFDHELTRL